MINNIGDSINDINGGSPKSSILKGFSIVNHPFGSTLIYGNPHVDSAVSMPPVHLGGAAKPLCDFLPRPRHRDWMGLGFPGIGCAAYLYVF